MIKIASVGKSRASLWMNEEPTRSFVGERVRKRGDGQRDCASNYKGRVSYSRTNVTSKLTR
jgi:hypothetical protein